VSDDTPSTEPTAEAAPVPVPVPVPAPAPAAPQKKQRRESAIRRTIPALRALVAQRTVSLVLVAAVGAVLLLGGLLIRHAESKINKVALAASPKPVTLTLARARPYQPTRMYVGTLEPWLVASIGPQLVSAYIDTVLVRPGAVVKRGDVLATLDCRDASAANRAVAMTARAIDARQKALASESARVQGLLAGKFVSPNEAEQKSAASDAEAAELEAMKAKLSHSTLEVSDCILRAPFDGEVATRTMDPGAFVHPGMAIVSVVDRSTVRFTADVPEIDFAGVPEGTAVQIHLPSTGEDVPGIISRRSPAADPSTRTIHFEVDLADPERRIPVGTTGEAHLEVGKPEPATEVPLFAASTRGKKATVWVVEGDVAHQRTVNVKGELGGSLFVDESLAAGTTIVTEGRALLADGDRVSSRMEPEASSRGPRGAPVIPVKATATPAVREHHP
jgi:membrane fusion protein (multidrug efflux system)